MKIDLPHGENFIALKREFKPPITQEEFDLARRQIVAQRLVDCELYSCDSSQGFNWKPDEIDNVSEGDIIAQITHNRCVRVMETEMVDAKPDDALPVIGGVIGRYDSHYNGSFDVVLFIGNGDVNYLLIGQMPTIVIGNCVDTFRFLADVIQRMINQRFDNGRIG